MAPHTPHNLQKKISAPKMSCPRGYSQGCPVYPPSTPVPKSVPGPRGPQGPRGAPGVILPVNATCVNPDAPNPNYVSEVLITTNGPAATQLVNNVNTILVRFDEVTVLSGGTEYMVVSDREVTIRKESDYAITLSLTLALVNPLGTATVGIWDFASQTQLTTQPLVSNEPVTVVLVGHFTPGMRFGLYVAGVNINAVRTVRLHAAITASDAPEDLRRITINDRSWFIRYIPARPSDFFVQNPGLYAPQFPNPAQTFPWFSPVIPWKANQVLPPNPLPVPLIPVSGNDYYDKLGSVPNSIAFFLGIDFDIIDPADPQLSVFLTNFINRGADNYRKKAYMAAMTSNMLPNYADKVDQFINVIYSDWTTYGKPVLSSFKTALVNFFLAVHIGYDEYPEFVVKYFTLFIDVIGFGDPCREGRDEALLYGHDNVAKVRAYFRERNALISQTKDTSTLVYWWGLAGLAPEGLVMESIHNIIAFNQFLNVVYLLINDQFGNGTLQPLNTNPPSAALKKYFFLDKFKAAGTDNVLKLNIVRELFRLTVPNTASFSLTRQVEPGTVPSPAVATLAPAALAALQGAYAHQTLTCPIPVNLTVSTIQTRLTHKATMFIAYQALGREYSDYDTDQYGTNFGLNYNTTLTANLDPPTIIPENILDGIDPATLLVTSTVDLETVLEKGNPDLTPVYPISLYNPFGLGYRRCPGEPFTNLMAQMMMEKMVDMEFDFVPGDYPNIPVAPYTSYPDNIFWRSTN